MMYSIIFIILLLAVVSAWVGYRQITMTTFAIALILSLYNFIIHLSTALLIQL